MGHLKVEAREILKSVVSKFVIFNLMLITCICVVGLFSCSSTSTSTPTPTPTPTPSITPEMNTKTSVPSESTVMNNGFVSVSLSDTSTASYLIRERLARLELPNDAIGETEQVTGRIIFDAQGSIQDSSQFTVNVKSLVSDESRRDRYVRNNTLKTEIYPEVYFKIQSIEDLSWPLPSTGSHQFRFIGDITIMDVTRSITWHADVIFSEQSLTGVARTTVLFEDFSITKPSLSFILSVADEIRLELEFSAAISRS